MTRAANAFEILAALGPIGHANVTDFQNAVQFISTNTEGLSMPSLKELREKRGELNKKFQAIVNKAESENRDITPEENSTLNEINADDSALVTEIRKKEAENRSVELSQAIEMTGQRRGGFLDAFDSRSRPDEDFAFGVMAASAAGRNVDSSDWERAERAGYRAGADSLTIHLRSCRPTPGNQALFGPGNAMGTKVPSRGGAWTPASFKASLEKAMKQFGPMIETSEVIVTESGEEMAWPTFNDAENVAQLVGENQQVPETDVTTGAQKFGSHKLSSGILRISNETLADSPLDIASELGAAFGERIGRGTNRLCTLGDAPNSPRGIVPNATVGKVTASSTVITADELIDMVASVNSAYRQQPGAGWMMHSEVFSAISKLKDNNGNYLVGTLEDGSNPKLRGYPVHFNDDMSNTFAAGERIAIFGDLRAYKIRYVGQIRIIRLVEKYADYDQTGLVAFMRVDGGLLDAGTHPVKCLQMKP